MDDICTPFIALAINFAIGLCCFYALRKCKPDTSKNIPDVNRKCVEKVKDYYIL